MLNFIFLQIAINLSLLHNGEQDSTLTYLQNEIYRIDSVSLSIDMNHSLETKTIVGVTAWRNQYKGTSYFDLNKKELEKLTITSVGTGNQETIYTSGSKGLKIIQGSQQFYVINNAYYTRQLTKVSSPELLENFADLESIVMNVHKILSPEKR